MILALFSLDINLPFFGYFNIFTGPHTFLVPGIPNNSAHGIMGFPVSIRVCRSLCVCWSWLPSCRQSTAIPAWKSRLQTLRRMCCGPRARVSRACRSAKWFSRTWPAGDGDANGAHNAPTKAITIIYDMQYTLTATYTINAAIWSHQEAPA